MARPCKHGSTMPRISHGRCPCSECRSERAQRTREWQKANPGRQRALVAKWQAANPAKVREIGSAARAKRKGADADYRQLNSAAIMARNQKRRAIKLSASPAWQAELDELVFSEAAALAQMRRSYTGIEWQVDHMLPLQARELCGLHVAENIAVIPAAMNSAKRNRLVLTTPGAWVRGQ